METDKILKGFGAKIDQMTSLMSELLIAIGDVQQRQKHMQYTLAKGKDPEAFVPKGETSTALCEECGSRMHIKDAMKQVKHVGDKLITFTICRKCFYHKR